MPRLTARSLLSPIIAVLLALPVLVLVAPAHADEPLRETRVSVTPFNELDDETRIGIAASVSPVAFVPGNWGITGTVTIRDDEGTVLASGLTPDPGNGYTMAYVAKPTRPTTYYADFDGTGVWADSAGSKLYTPSRLRTVTLSPEPTLLKITAGSPKLTLTLSAYARFKDGTPAPGVTVFFSGDCLIPGPRMCSLPLEWCEAVTNSSGFATCKGAGTLGSIVSILGGSVWVSGHSYNSGYYVTGVTRAPVIVTS